MAPSLAALRVPRSPNSCLERSPPTDRAEPASLPSKALALLGRALLEVELLVQANSNRATRPEAMRGSLRSANPPDRNQIFS